MIYVVDSHALFWFFTEGPKLSNKAKEIFNIAEEGEAEIIIPSISLLELLHILEKKKRANEFDSIINKIEEASYYEIYSLDIEIIKRFLKLKA